jgi:hypothetical protein
VAGLLGAVAGLCGAASAWAQPTVVLPPEAQTATQAGGASRASGVRTAADPKSTADQRPAAAASLRGVVLEKGTRSPLAGAQVVLPDLQTETYCDGDGKFAFDDLPAGPLTIYLPGDDHQPLRQEVVLKANSLARVTLRPERKSYTRYRAVAVAPPQPGQVTQQSVTRQEIAKIPGSNGDSFVAVTNLPGVARTGSYSGQLVVRGSSPNDTQTLVEGVEVPLLFHFGGVYSVFNTDLIDAIDFQPGVQPARIGRRTGGLVEARLAVPKYDDGWHGAAEFNVFHAGFRVDGPLTDRTRLAVAARRSYIDVVLDTVVPEGALPFAVAPKYSDWQLKLDHRISDRGSASLFLFGVNDSLSALVDKPPAAFPDARGNISQSTNYVSGIGVLRLGGDNWKSKTTIGFTPLNLNAALGDAIKFQLAAQALSLREDLDWKMNPSATLRGGMDWRWQPYTISLKLPFTPNTGEPGTGTGNVSSSVAVTQGGYFYWPGLWLDAVLKPLPSLEIVPGARLDIYRGYTDGTAGVQRFDQTVSPRLSGKYQFDKRWTLLAAAGWTSQLPEPQQLGTQVGNPNLKAIRGFEASLGARLQLTEAIQFDVQAFDKRLWNLVVANREWPAKGAPYTNDGEGHVRGLEILARHRPIGPFFGWLSYTLQKASRVDRPGEPERLFGWDQTHIFTAVTSVKLPRNWEVGGRWRYVSGSPYTGVATAVWNGDNDTWQRVPSTCVNCERLPAFHQLDVRVDKTWAFDGFLLVAYLDLQNAYNRANPEAIQYSYDARQSTFQSGLPLIPSFGVRGEF